MGDESSLDKMISMMGMQMQQDFAMRCQELAMQQQILQSQQQMMNMFMMSMMGQNINLQNNEKKRRKDHNLDSNVDSD